MTDPIPTTPSAADAAPPRPDFGGLMRYHEEFVPTFLSSSRTKRPVSRRRASEIAKEYNFQLINISGILYIDPQQTADQLRAVQLGDCTPRRPGRPPKAKAAGTAP